MHNKSPSAGRIAANISDDVSGGRLQRFFTKEEAGYRVRPGIREMAIFSPHSLILHPPFTKVDVLSCRNLLIYLSAEMQRKLCPLFHYSLNPDGILFLGNAETARLINLIPGDAGRPITDLAADLLYPALAADARRVLAKHGGSETAVAACDGRWFTVRIAPYRTLGERIAVVVTFLDISRTKALEGRLRDLQLTLEQRPAGPFAKRQRPAKGPAKH